MNLDSRQSSAHARMATLIAFALLLGGCTMGVPELLIILGIVVVLFGATRLPALGRALGETVRSFKESTSGNDSLEAKKDDKKVEQIEDAKVERIDDKKS